MYGINNELIMHTFGLFASFLLLSLLKLFYKWTEKINKLRWEMFPSEVFVIIG